VAGTPLHEGDGPPEPEGREVVDPLAPASFFPSRVEDDLMEICIRLCGELWVTRERLRVLEEHLEATGVIAHGAVEARPLVEPTATAAHRLDRQAFVERVFGAIARPRP
jgi:hypothetical protein